MKRLQWFFLTKVSKTMPSSEVVYRRGDHYRPLDEDILRSRRSSSTASSGSKAKRPSAFATSTPKASALAISSPALRYGPGPHEYLTKKKVSCFLHEPNCRRGCCRWAPSLFCPHLSLEYVHTHSLVTSKNWKEVRRRSSSNCISNLFSVFSCR